MIGYVVDALVARILTPQTLDTVSDELRISLDPTGDPGATGLAEVDVIPGTSRPGTASIGGGSVPMTHTVELVLTVIDGDRAEAVSRRDSIVTDLVLRLAADRTLGGATSADGRQYVNTSRWAVDYADLQGDTTLAAYALLTVTVEADLDV